MSNLWQYGWGLLGCQLFLDGPLNKFPRDKVTYIISYIVFIWKYLIISLSLQNSTDWQDSQTSHTMNDPTSVTQVRLGRLFVWWSFLMKAEHPNKGRKILGTCYHLILIKQRSRICFAACLGIIKLVKDILQQKPEIRAILLVTRPGGMLWLLEVVMMMMMMMMRMMMMMMMRMMMMMMLLLLLPTTCY